MSKDKSEWVQDVEADLMATTCPECGHDGLNFCFRCDLQFGECLATASCGQCSMVFIVEIEEDFPPSVQNDIDDTTPAKRISCDPVTRTCTYE
ncbi:MAG: hypothetical protein IPJ88_12060 [Myxococcales bacterium]|nr:MAG: hypothetical protein IPJ88_12060 [Myxococcales bacterium]